jgi:flagellar motor switch protein FliN/FliY
MSQTDIDDILASETASTQTPSTSEKTEMPGNEKDSYQVIHNEIETFEPAPAKQIDFPKTAEIQRILKLQVPIIVRLAEKVMPMGEVMKLAPGAIIEFSKCVSEPLELMINNKCTGIGQAVKVGEKFGIRIMNLSTISQVIKAMAGK